MYIQIKKYIFFNKCGGNKSPPPPHTHFYMPVTLVPNILSSSGFGAVHQAQLCVGPSFFFFYRLHCKIQYDQIWSMYLSNCQFVSTLDFYRVQPLRMFLSFRVGQLKCFVKMFVLNNLIDHSPMDKASGLLTADSEFKSTCSCLLY